MTIITIIIIACLAFLGIGLGITYRIAENTADSSRYMINELQAKLGENTRRLDALNAAVKELTEWTAEQDDKILGVKDTNRELLKSLQDTVVNLEQTDRRCREIERYYCTYVARKEAPDDQVQKEPISDE